MARTIKYSKEDILEISVDFIKEHGYSKLTARELAKYIGCSTGPIFKNYENFDMYKEDLKFYLRKDYSSFIYKYVDIKDYLYTISYAYAFYAKKEVLKYGVRIESETLDDFSRAFVYEKFGGCADEKINCLTKDSHIHVSTKSEVKAILDAYVWIVINKKDN